MDGVNSVCVLQEMSFLREAEVSFVEQKLQWRINRGRTGMGGPADLLTDESLV